MNHQRELDHSSAGNRDSVDHDVTAPGRRSRSTQLDAPATPSSSGMLLPDDLRGRFEQSLGTDLSGVRVHTGGDSDRAARTASARAFAVGNDIHFGSGEYDPGSQAGQHLIAHEVAHTVQQRGGTPQVQHKLAVSSPGDSFEVEADRAADAMVAGTPYALAPAPTMIARTPSGNTSPAPSDDAADGADGEKKAETRYPSWKDDTLEVPVLGKLGGKLGLTWGDNPGAKLGFGGGAKAELFEHKYGASVQLAPGITGSLVGSVGASLDAKADLTGKGSWIKEEGNEESSLVLSITGKGDVGFSASGAITVAAGVGIANVVGLEGGLKGEITANAKTGVSLAGTLTRSPNGTTTGALTMSVTASATLTAGAAIVAEVITPGKRIGIYERSLGDLTLGELSIVCLSTLAGAKAVDPPPVVTAKWLPVPPLEERETRDLTPEERRKWKLEQTEVGQGASGGSAVSPGDAPTSVELTDQELFDKGKALANEWMGAQAVGAVSCQDNNTAGKSVTVNVNGSLVRGYARYSKELRAQDPFAGRKLKKIVGGTIEQWDYGYGANVGIVKDCAKNAVAVARLLLMKHATVVLRGEAFEYEQIPPQQTMPSKCYKDGRHLDTPESLLNDDY